MKLRKPVVRATSPDDEVELLWEDGRRELNTRWAILVRGECMAFGRRRGEKMLDAVGDVAAECEKSNLIAAASWLRRLLAET